MANGLIGKVTAGGGTHLIASTAYFTCETAAATVAKEAKAADTNLDSLTVITGMTIYVKFTDNNGVANPTLTLQTNGGTELFAAKPIKRYGTTAPSTNAATSWQDGAVVALTYDGTNGVEVTAVDTNDNTLLRTYKAYATNVELPLIGGSTGSTSPAAPTGETSYANLYGQIPKTTANRATYNLSTGKITVPGGVVANVTGTASKATADADGNTISSTYVKKAGDTMSGKLTVGTTSQSAAPTASITIHDTRNYTGTPTSLDKGVNGYFTQSNSPDTSKGWSIMHLMGGTGDYNAGELAGPSHNADQRTTPLYVRSGRTTNGGGSGRKIYDTSNKPSIADHSYTPAGTITLTNGNTTATVSAASSGTTTYTPGGTVSQPTFTGSSLTSTGNFTPTGSVSVSTNATTNKTATVSAASSGTATYTPAGTIAVSGTTSTATVVKTATFNTVVTSATVSSEILTISTGAAGSSTNQASVRIADPAYTFTGTPVRLVTGNIAVPNTYTATFTGTQGSVSVSGTPAGTVSQPTFSGTAVRLVTGNISRPTSATFTGDLVTLTHSVS